LRRAYDYSVRGSGSCWVVLVGNYRTRRQRVSPTFLTLWPHPAQATRGRSTGDGKDNDGYGRTSHAQYRHGAHAPLLKRAANEEAASLEHGSGCRRGCGGVSSAVSDAMCDVVLQAAKARGMGGRAARRKAEGCTTAAPWFTPGQSGPLDGRDSIATCCKGPRLFSGRKT
jgi:hypothetical protein